MCWCNNLQRVTATQNRVNVTDRMWARLLSSTNQPDFLNYPSVIRQREQLREDSAKPEKNEGTGNGTGNGSARHVVEVGSIGQLTTGTEASGKITSDGQGL